jgi:adenosylmethionine---8-amino-7-oxononanoate aminotransferase
MVGIELIKDKEKKIDYLLEERIGHKVTLAARRRGVVVRPLGPVIVLMPPLSISEEELKILTRAVFESVEEVCGR